MASGERRRKAANTTNLPNVLPISYFSRQRPGVIHSALNVVRSFNMEASDLAGVASPGPADTEESVVKVAIQLVLSFWY